MPMSPGGHRLFLLTAHQKIPFFMKVSFHLLSIILLSSNLLLARPGMGQRMEDKVITLGLYNASLPSALKKVEKLSGFRIAYATLLVGQFDNIQLSKDARSVSQTLSLILSNTNLAFNQEGNTIYIYQSSAATGKSDVPVSFSSGEWEIPPVSGQVLDEQNNPIAGVTVALKGTQIGTVTGADGNFSINIPGRISNPVLVVSFIGYLTEEIRVDGNTPLNIVLQLDQKGLNEVVVVGYGTQRRKDLTGSIASVSAKEIEQRPIATFDQALFGVVPGIDVTPRNNKAGNLGSIRIRGVGSISGDTEPLYVIDGFPTDATNAGAINPADIASIDILKDASSTAIYGSRGANGVVIITTKSGRTGASKVDVSLKTGFSKTNKNDFYDVLNGEQYVQWYREKAMHNNQPVPAFVTNWDGTSTDWQELIYRTAPFHDYSFAVSGGTDKLTYLMSGGFLNQEDILLAGGFDKFSARIKLDYRPSKRITLGLNLAPNFTHQRISAPDNDYSSLTGAAVLLPPIIPAFKEDGTPTDVNTFGVLANTMVNPITIADKYRNTVKSLLMMSNAYLQVDILEGLTAKTSIGANITDRRDRLFQPGLRGPALSAVTQLNLSSRRTVNWLNENTLNYKRTFGDVHSVDVVAGYTVQKVDIENVGATANTFPSDLGQTIGFGNVRNGNSDVTGNTLLSYLARANYSYDDRYLLTATIRRDGSSRFGANNRWGVFPSFAFGWNVSNEKFMERVNFVDNAKIRVSYGSTGSNFIGDFTSRASMQTVNHSFNGNNVLGFLNADAGNPDLSWEISQQLDVGLDLSLGNRFNLTFDYFNNTTRDLLLLVNVPTSTGYSGNLTNIGKMRKWGYEVSLNANIVRTKDFSWDVGGNVTRLNQEVLQLGPTGAALFQFFGVLITEIGGALEQARGVKQIGILTQDDIDKGVARRPLDKPGDFKFLDANNDGIIDAFNGQDGVLLGDNNPNWLYGINTSVRYKNFRLSALLNGQAGGDIMDFVFQIFSLHANNTNMSTFFYDGRYVSEAEPGNGLIPRAGYNDEGAVSSWEMQSTDFLRIRNINLTYTFPASLSQRLWLNDLRAYISVENVHTFTKYIGGNPQASRLGNGRLGGVTDGRTISLNSVATPPIPRVFTLGVNFSF